MLTINKPEKSGFDIFLSNEDFKCAFITAHDQYSFGRIKKIKRHNDSDEVLVLLQGNAKLVTAESLDEEFAKTALQPNVAYNVNKSTWHYLAVSNDAILFVAENGRVSCENTDTADIFHLNIIV